MINPFFAFVHRPAAGLLGLLLIGVSIGDSYAQQPAPKVGFDIVPQGWSELIERNRQRLDNDYQYFLGSDRSDNAPPAKEPRRIAPPVPSVTRTVPSASRPTRIAVARPTGTAAIDFVTQPHVVTQPNVTAEPKVTAEPSVAAALDVIAKQSDLASSAKASSQAELPSSWATDVLNPQTTDAETMLPAAWAGFDLNPQLPSGSSAMVAGQAAPVEPARLAEDSQQGETAANALIQSPVSKETIAVDSDEMLGIKPFARSEALDQAVTRSLRVATLPANDSVRNVPSSSVPASSVPAVNDTAISDSFVDALAVSEKIVSQLESSELPATDSLVSEPSASEPSASKPSASKPSAAYTLIGENLNSETPHVVVPRSEKHHSERQSAPNEMLATERASGELKKELTDEEAQLGDSNAEPWTPQPPKLNQFFVDAQKAGRQPVARTAPIPQLTRGTTQQHFPSTAPRRIYSSTPQLRAPEFDTHLWQLEQLAQNQNLRNQNAHSQHAASLSRNVVNPTLMIPQHPGPAIALPDASRRSVQEPKRWVKETIGAISQPIRSLSDDCLLGRP